MEEEKMTAVPTEPQRDFAAEAEQVRALYPDLREFPDELPGAAGRPGDGGAAAGERGAASERRRRQPRPCPGRHRRR